MVEQSQKMRRVEPVNGRTPMHGVPVMAEPEERATSKPERLSPESLKRIAVALFGLLSLFGGQELGFLWASAGDVHRLEARLEREEERGARLERKLDQVLERLSAPREED